MLTVLILIVFAAGRAGPGPACRRCRRYTAGTARNGDEPRGAEPDRRYGPATARGLPAQACSQQTAPQGDVAGPAAWTEEDKPSARREEVDRCRHTPSSK